MFTLIEDQAAIKKAQSELEATISREFPRIAIQDIGWQGGRRPKSKLHTNGTYWFWSADHRVNVANPRRLNWFGRIGEGSGVSIAVEVNTPYKGRNNTVGGFFARNAENGRTYLFHSGRVGGGARGVRRDALVAWSGLQLQKVYASDGSQKEGILVMPTVGRGAVRPAIAYVQEVIDFKAAVRNRGATFQKFESKEPEARDFYDEFFGRKKGKFSARDIDYVSRHGEVVKELFGWRKRKGLVTGQSIRKSVFLDLGVYQGEKIIEAYEVKTSATRGDIYTGIGQLFVHAKGCDCKRILVLPADKALASGLSGALARNNIILMRYRLNESSVRLL